jgi:hypothetical protein
MRYSEDVKKFIAENVQGITTKDLAILVNAKFGTNFTEDKMKCYKANHNLKSGRRGVPVGRPSRIYPDEVKVFIKENHNGVGPKEMASKLNETFGTNYTHKQLKAWYGRHKFNSGVTGCFPKGNVPANKGKKGISYEGMKATQFKKGSKSANWVPIGTERINRDGYTEVKIADGKLNKNWKAKHIFVWETANGPVPEGHVVIFGDGNHCNLDLSNLLLVSRKQLVRLNQNHLIQNDTELTKTGIIIADIISKIGERKKAKRRL